MFLYKFLTISVFDFCMCSIAFTAESTSAGSCGPHLPNAVNRSDSLAAARERCCVQDDRDLLVLGTKNGLDLTFFISLRQISTALAPLGRCFSSGKSLVFAMLQ